MQRVTWIISEQLVNTIASANIVMWGVGERSGSRPAAKDDATQRVSEMEAMCGDISEARFTTSLGCYPGENLPENCHVAGRS